MSVLPATQPILPPEADNPWNDPDLSRRLGRFRIPRTAELVYGLNLLHKIQSSCIIRWMQAEWHIDEHTVYAINPTFETVPEGNLIPWYDLIIEDHGDNILSFRFEIKEAQEEPEAMRFFGK